MKIKLFLIPIIVLSIFFSGIYVLNAQADVRGIALEPDTKSTPLEPDTKSTPKSSPVIKLESPLKAKNLKELLFSLVDFGIFLGSIIAVFMFIWIGFKFVLARGNSSELSSAREWFLYAVIGTAILISSRVIVEVVKNTLISSGVANEEIWKQ